MFKCEYCKHEFTDALRDNGEYMYADCPKCNTRSGGKLIEFYHIRGDAGVYVQGLSDFKLNDRDWKNDIRSRRTLPNGKIGRFDQRGRRIG